MNMTHVLAFHRVASAGSFTLAARMSGVSQPTLSAQVRALEQVVGGPLFERSHRRIKLTVSGETLFEATQHLSTALDEVERVLTRQKVQTSGTLRVSADSAVHVLPVLAQLKQRSAVFNFSLHIDNSAAVIEHVLNNESDVGVMARPTTDQRLFSMKIRHDRLVVLASAGDPLARRRRVRLRDLEGCDLVVRERGSITREVAEAELKRQRICLGRVLDVATRETVLEAVAAGFGIGIVFASEAGRDQRLKAMAIADADLSVAEYAICRAERRHLRLIARFLETAQQVALSSGWLADPARMSAIASSQKR